MRTFDCPACSAPLEFVGATTARCRFCGSNVIVPGEVFRQPTPAAQMPVQPPPRQVHVSRRGLMIVIFVFVGITLISGILPLIIGLIAAVIAAVAGAASM